MRKFKVLAATLGALAVVIGGVDDARAQTAPAAERLSAINWTLASPYDDTFAAEAAALRRSPGFDQLAAEGDARAQLIAALDLQAGAPTADQWRAWRRLLDASAAQNFPPAQMMLAFALMSPPTADTEAAPVEGLAMLRRAADADYAPAQYLAALVLINGLADARPDTRAGLSYMRRASDLGLGEAQAFQGALLARLSDEAKDARTASATAPDADADTEAVRLLRLAAAQGNQEAQGYLGYMIEFGRGGLAPDRGEAIRLYRMAANDRHGANAFAQAQLSRLGLPAS